MPAAALHNSQVIISRRDACRFLLAHHRLWPPRQLNGKSGVLAYIRHVNSIQFDPINIVGRNPDLVLQSRVADYRAEYLDQLLYKDRQLVDGWDKMACIYSTTDWPFFNRRRNFLKKNDDPRKPPEAVLDDVLDEIQRNAPISSLDFKDHDKVDWHWGPTKAGRAALEYLFAHGGIGIHHRVNNRRYFDLIERLLTPNLLELPDPFADSQEYQDWHVFRRIGSLGIAVDGGGDYWLGMLNMKSQQRKAALKRLIEQDKIIPLAIDEIPGKTFFIRAADLPTLENIQKHAVPIPQAALIAPLDNLLWNRKLIENLFDFSYIWEVYKPKAQRQYGYYVLPVLYGDRFVARLDPTFDKKKRILTLQNWWWEADIQLESTMQTALLEGLKNFGTYLNARQIVLAEPILTDSTLGWMKKLR